MSDLFEVELPDGRIIEVEGAPNAEAARARVTTFLQQEQQARPIDAFGESFMSGLRGTGGSAVRAGEAAAAAVGAEGPRNLFQQFSRRIGGTEDTNPQTRPPELEDLISRRALEAARAYAGQGLGSLGANLIGGAVGAGAGALIGGVPGAAAGLRAGTLGTAYTAGMGELYQGLVDEGIDPQTAGLIGISVGAIIGRIETRYLENVLQRQLRGRVDPGTIERVARRLIAGRDGGVRQTALAAGLSEAGGETMRQATRAAVTGDLNLGERGRQVLEEGIVGFAPGATMGAINRVRGVAGDQTPAAPPAPPAPETPPSLLREPLARGLPEEPEPVTTADEARQILAANPEFAAPEGTTDEGLIVRANDVLRSVYRDQVTTIRSETLADFTGSRAAITRPGELNAEGVQQPDVVDYSRAAPTLVRNILNAQGQGTLESDRFTVNQVADLAMARLGLDGASMSRAEKTNLKSLLDSYVEQGYLNKAGKGYTIATRQTAGPPRSQDGIAPPTNAEVAAPQALAALSEVQASPTLANMKAALEAVQGTPLQQEVENYLALVQQSRMLQLQRRGLTGNRPEEAAILQDISNQLNDITNQQAAIIERLEGRAAGTLAGPDSRTGDQPSPAGYVGGEQLENVLAGEADFTTQVGRSMPNLPPGWAAQQEQARREAAARAAAPQIQARDERQIAEAIIERPAEAQAFVQDLANSRPEGSRFDATTIREAAREQGIELSPQTSIQLYDVARRTGVVNRLGVIPPRVASAPTQTPPTETPPTEQSVETTEAAPTDSHDSPAFMESEPDQNAMPDERTTDDPAFMRGRASNYLPGLEIRDDGSFSYELNANTPQGEGTVVISGEVLPDSNALWIGSASAPRHIRGQGYGIQAYQNLVDWAHANNYDVWSDAAVSDSASNVYNALARRGYNVDRNPDAYRSDGGWVSYTPETRRTAQPVFKINRDRPAFARSDTQTGPQTPLDMEVAREAGERAFRRVLGRNGRLEIQDEIFLKDLGDVFRIAAERAGIPNLEGPVSGYAYRDLAALALRNNDLPIDQTAIHEGFHVAENIGLFRPNEIALLNANADKILAVIRQQLPTVPDFLPKHEIRAYGLNARVAQRANFGSTINRIFDKLTNFLERIGNFLRGQGFQTWRDVYDAFEAGGMANRTPTNPSGIVGAGPNFMAAQANNNKAKVQRATQDEITGIMKWFGSPVMTMGKLKPNLRAAGDVQKTLYTRANEMIGETEEMLVGAHRLPPASVSKITRAWETASRTRKAPDMTGFTAAERAALQGEMAAVQRALDYFIESAALSNFLPTANKPAAIRAKLEKFWERHQGKHLWEIPQRELAAASPEGVREMQKYERIRNPYYMPMMGRGSHFVASYKRKPDGSRGQLVGLVAYTPRNAIQRFRGFSDPEADARAQLQAEFPADKFITMDQGQQFTRDSEAQGVREQGDFIAKYMTQLADASRNNKDALRLIRDMTNQIDKAQLERIFRPNQDILRAVTPSNESSYILDVMPQYLLSMSRVQARRYTQDAYTEATKALSPNDQAFLDQLRDYATTPSEAYGGLRATAFFMYLGGALDTALINATQTTHTAAMLVRDGDTKALPILGRTMAQLAGSTSIKQLMSGSNAFLDDFKAKISPEERAAVDQAIAQGVFSPVFTNESRSQFTVDGLKRAGFKDAQAAQRKLTFLSQLAGRPMQWVEEYNRSVAFMSAFRLAQQDPSVITRSNQVDKTDYKDAYSYAVGKVIDTQYLTTKEDRAYVQRFTPAAEVMTQFMSYPLKTIEQYIRATGIIVAKDSDMASRKAGAVMLLGMAAPLIGLAGIWSLPFADSFKEWAEMFTKLIWGNQQNFDAELREMLGGGQFAEAVVRGIPHSQGWFALSRRLALDPMPAQELMGMNMVTLFGPAGSMIEAPVKAYQYFNNGDYWQLAASLMPRAVGNVVRGMQLATDQEQYTLRGNRVITPQDVERHDDRSLLPASVRQALGFPPPEFANIRETVQRSEEIQRATRVASERINKQLAGFLVDMMDANRRGDTATATNAVRRYSERLAEFVRQQENRPAHLRVNINQNAIVERARRDFYGIASQESLSRTGRAASRPEVERQRQMLDWRNQSN